MNAKTFFAIVAVITMILAATVVVSDVDATDYTLSESDVKYEPVGSQIIMLLNIKKLRRWKRSSLWSILLTASKLPIVIM